MKVIRIIVFTQLFAIFATTFLKAHEASMEGRFSIAVEMDESLQREESFFTVIEDPKKWNESDFAAVTEIVMHEVKMLRAAKAYRLLENSGIEVGNFEFLTFEADSDEKKVLLDAHQSLASQSQRKVSAAQLVINDLKIKRENVASRIHGYHIDTPRGVFFWELLLRSPIVSRLTEDDLSEVIELLKNELRLEDWLRILQSPQKIKIAQEIWKTALIEVHELVRLRLLTKRDQLKDSHELWIGHNAVSTGPRSVRIHLPNLILSTVTELLDNDESFLLEARELIADQSHVMDWFILESSLLNRKSLQFESDKILQWLKSSLDFLLNSEQWSKWGGWHRMYTLESLIAWFMSNRSAFSEIERNEILAQLYSKLSENPEDGIYIGMIDAEDPTCLKELKSLATQKKRK